MGDREIIRRTVLRFHSGNFMECFGGNNFFPNFQNQLFYSNLDQKVGRRDETDTNLDPIRIYFGLGQFIPVKT